MIPFYPKRYGAIGDGNLHGGDELAALNRCYTACKNARQGGESAVMVLDPGARYSIESPFKIDTSNTWIFGRGACIQADSTFSANSWEGVVYIDNTTTSTLNELHLQDFTIDINGESAFGLSNDWNSATDDNMLKKSLFRNITVDGNIAGKHCVKIRNPENGVKLENFVIDGFASTNANPTAAIYVHDRGSGANHGNFYIKSPFIATNSTGTINGRGVWIDAVGVHINRNYIGGPGAHFFNWSSGGASTDNYGIFISSTMTGGAEEVRTFIISDINMEDWREGIHIEHTGASSGIRNFNIHDVSIEYKNPADEAGVQNIDIAGADASGYIHHCFLQSSSPNSTAINCDSDAEVWVDHVNTMLKATGTWVDKFEGTALNNNPITFHLGNIHEFGGCTNTFSGATDRYPAVYGTSSTGSGAASTESNERTTAKRYYALRQIVAKPNTNSWTNNGTLAFRINGASALSATITAGDTSEITATASTFIEIDPTDLINWFIDANAAEAGSIKFAYLRAICEELHYGAD